MYYHVRISTKSQPNRDEVRLDLTKEELEERFLRPYRQELPMVIGGRTVPTSDLTKLRVNVTDDPSAFISSVIQAKRRADKVAASALSDWHIADYGREVTDQLITAPPGRDSFHGSSRADTGSAGADEPDPRSVFVVHGRNMAARDAIFSFLRALHLEPIEWNETIQATGRSNPFIGEVLKEAFSRARAVLVLMTPDDEARLRAEYRQDGDPSHEARLTPQARANVLFEAGMAMAWDENRTVLVELGNCRPFSDIAGRHILRLNNSTQRRQELAERLRTAGAAVRTTGTDWHTVGEFSVPA